MSDWRLQRPDKLPVPDPAAEAEGHFEALRQGRLLLQRCIGCGELSHPPRSMCRECHGMEFDWLEASGHGTVYSYVITQQAIHPALVGHTPFATVQVELDEGPIMVSNLVDVPPQDITIGMRVGVVFERIDNEVTLPLFARERA